MLKSVFNIDKGKEVLGVQSKILNFLYFLLESSFLLKFSKASFLRIIIYYKKFRSFNFHG